MAAPSSSGPIRIAHGIDYSVCLTSLTVCLLSVFLLDKGIPGRLAFPALVPGRSTLGRLKMRSGPCPHRHTPPPELSFSLRQAIFASLPIVVVLILLPAIAFASPPDQLWIAGIYDGADGDESVTLVYETAGVEATPTRPVPLLPRLSEILLVSRPGSVHGPAACPSTRAPPAPRTPISYSVHSGPQFPATFPAYRVTQQHFLSTTCPFRKIEEASRSGSLDGSPVSGECHLLGPKPTINASQTSPLPPSTSLHGEQSCRA